MHYRGKTERYSLPVRCWEKIYIIHNEIISYLKVQRHRSDLSGCGEGKGYLRFRLEDSSSVNGRFLRSNLTTGDVWNVRVFWLILYDYGGHARETCYPRFLGRLVPPTVPHENKSNEWYLLIPKGRIRKIGHFVLKHTGPNVPPLTPLAAKRRMKLRCIIWHRGCGSRSGAQCRPGFFQTRVSRKKMFQSHHVRYSIMPFSDFSVL